MAKTKKRGTRDGGQFLALPHVVLESPGWAQAGHTARSLLIDVATQYTGRNNGRLVATVEVLGKRGWRSPSVLCHARQELIACGLLVETRKGGFPNKAAWYALSWLGLDQQDDLDINPRQFETLHRRGYLKPDPYKRPRRAEKKNAPLATSCVATTRGIATRRVAGG